MNTPGTTASTHTPPAFQPRLDCIECMVRQAQEAVAQLNPSPELAEQTLRRVLRLLVRADWTLSAPALGQKVHRLIRRTVHQADPYARIKAKLNQRAVQLYPRWSRRFREAHPPLEAAVRLAIVGNLLDVGAKTRLGEDAIETAFTDALTAPLQGAIPPFAEAISQARQILYLADNAGEIVFDRDLLAQLPLGKCTFVVRGAPVLNDATRADAAWAHLDEYCEIMDNGSDAPGTLLEDCCVAFREQFAAADLIIAKGQGNFESLAGVAKNIFFLLKVKCPVIARALRCPVGSLVLRHQSAANATRSASGSKAQSVAVETAERRAKESAN